MSEFFGKRARSGIKILRYDFSDPQAGKDICDRKTAPMKAHIKRWVNEKHDVLTAEDMKQAIESHGGLKGCRVAVVEVDISKDVVKDNKIPGISLLNNFNLLKKAESDPGERMTLDQVGYCNTVTSRYQLNQTLI